MSNQNPPIAPLTAAGLSVVYTLLYVVPFYLSKATRPAPTIVRDSVAVIRARIRAVTFSCMVTSVITVVIASRYALLDPFETLHLLGWWPVAPFDLFQTLVLVALLFLGPLFESAVIGGNWKRWLTLHPARESLSSWIGYRNYVAGPVTEEITFRSALIPLHMLARLSPARIVFVTPLYFGIAHIHHFYEFKLTNPNTPLVPALLRSLFQFTYTSLFGFYAAFIYLRTGSLLACVFTHSFCNWMGLPRLWGSIQNPETEEPLLVWTVVYYCLLALGAWGFYVNLFTLTQSSHALIQF